MSLRNWSNLYSNQEFAWQCYQSVTIEHLRLMRLEHSFNQETLKDLSFFHQQLHWCWVATSADLHTKRIPMGPSFNISGLVVFVFCYILWISLLFWRTLRYVIYVFTDGDEKSNTVLGVVSYLYPLFYATTSFCLCLWYMFSSLYN